MPSLRQALPSTSAMPAHSSSLSMTHGPAISTSCLPLLISFQVESAESRTPCVYHRADRCRTPKTWRKREISREAGQGCEDGISGMTNTLHVIFSSSHLHGTWN